MKKKFNHNILFIVVLIIAVLVVFGLAALQNHQSNISGTQSLMLNDQDLQQLEIASNGTGCQTEEQSSIYSSMVQYGVCYYAISSLNNTQIVLELKKFANPENLNGTYQYESSHLYSVQGLISENNFGDQSRFRVNNVNDYGGEYNPPGVYFYHLWICKDEYLIHITSSGSKEAEGYIVKIGQHILSKF